MKIADMTPEERERKRAYDREQKRKQRAEKKALERASQNLTADEASQEFESRYPARVRELDEHVRGFSSAVSNELGRPLDSIAEQYVIDRVGRSLIGLQRGWIAKCQSPGGDLATGELIAGSYFADVCSDMIEDSNRYGLRNSPTFDSAYVELLNLIVKRYGKVVPVSLDIQTARAELAGTYELPKPPETPAPEPEQVHEVIVPGTAEILFSARQKLLEQVRGHQFDRPGVTQAITSLCLLAQTHKFHQEKE